MKSIEFSMAKGVENSESETVLILAELRRRETDLKRLSLSLPPEQMKVVSDLIEKKSEELKTISKESATRELASVETDVVELAESFREAAPDYALGLYGNIAKLKQASGKSFKTELETTVNLDSLLDETIDLTPDKLSSQIQMVAILRKQAENANLPKVELLAKMASASKVDLKNIALVVSEKDREHFLSLLPEEKRREAAILIDNELSKVLSSKIIETEADKSQAGAIHARLVEFLQTSDKDASYIIEALGGSLKNLESAESIAILKEASKRVVAKTENNFSRTAHIVRKLAETDMASGKGLIMEFLGNKDLPERYFDYFLNYLHQQGSLTKSLDLSRDWQDEKYEKLFKYLEKNDAGWGDQANVTDNFKEGVTLFGYKNMFSYAGRQDVTPHDALSEFKKIIELQKTSTLPPAQFFSQVLYQVKLDGSTYESGLSYNEFNSLIGTIDYSDAKLENMSQKVKQYPAITKLQELNEYLSDPKKIFSSWFNLRKFSDLSYLLDQAEILEQLEDLKEDAQRNPQKAKLYDFIEQVAFNKTGKVDMRAVLEFWQDPETFLVRRDSHTPVALHDAVKPSNYTKVSYLDLSSSGLRDALVDGSLDKIQTFKPMEIIYSVDKEAKLNVELDFYSELKKQIGSRQEGTQNPKLFNEVKKILKVHKIDLLAYIVNKRDVVENLPQATQQIIQTEVREAIKQFPNEKITQNDNTKIAGKYRARMNYKGDPQAVLAGNDTSCCMPFGSGKNNCYMWNPTVGLFTLEEERGSGWRTIAQSVVSLDKNVGQDISVLANEVKNDPSRLVELLPENVIDENNHYIACDNIEVAQNFIAKKELIEATYRDFFSKYAPYFRKQSGIVVDTEKVLIGKSNSDLSFGTQEKNTYLPVSLIGYSDKLGSQVDVIRFNNIKKDTFSLTEKSIRKNEEVTGNIEKQNVKTLTSADALSVAYLEHKAYPKNMLGGMYKLQNEIFGQSINNSAKSRKDLSLKYTDAENKIKGYLLAYEGEKDNEKIIHINDWSVDPDSRIAGGRLINTFAEKYIEHYISKDMMMPIYMEARDEISYQIFQKQITKMSEKLGVYFDVKKSGTKKYGDSTMYKITLQPYKK